MDNGQGLGLDPTRTVTLRMVTRAIDATCRTANKMCKRGDTPEAIERDRQTWSGAMTALVLFQAALAMEMGYDPQKVVAITEEFFNLQSETPAFDLAAMKPLGNS